MRKQRQETALPTWESPPLSVPSGRWPEGSWAWCLNSAMSPLSVDMGHVRRGQKTKITGAKRHIYKKTKHFWLKIKYREFPGGLVVRILGFHCRGLGSIPGQGTEILQAMQHGPKKEKRKIKYKQHIFKNSFSPNISHGFCEGNISQRRERGTMIKYPASSFTVKQRNVFCSKIKVSLYLFNTNCIYDLWEIFLSSFEMVREIRILRT